MVASNLAISIDLPVRQSVISTREFRQTLAQFGSGLGVVGSRGPDGSLVGFTCQSFCSVSMDPPLVLICVSEHSESLDVILEAGCFSVSVLTAQQVSVAVLFGSKVEDKFQHTTYRYTPVGACPYVDGSAAWIDCAVHDERRAGDHRIVVGSVRALGIPPGQHLPLFFCQGRYATPAMEQA